ncbi:PLP-dependent aminotransferase family protein [Amycolatopsis sp. NPDC059027]|uniref:aminotransferase-like domain-containing protein n=1 Tax=Amycolatopsis sp. NPDC059027 TaxID=3346709 RepID=UPI00366F8B1F
MSEFRWDQVFARSVRSGAGDEITSILSQAGDDRIIAFSGGYPHPETFPRAAMEAGFANVLADPAALQYGPTGGLPGLRDWFSGWLGDHDGLRPSDGELIITSGGMEGLKLLTGCLLDAGDRVLVEGPSFMGAIMAIRNALGVIEAVPMDEHGLDVDALARTLADGRKPKFLYTIPDYQNPMGVSLSVERRHALVALARKHGLLLVEDVAYRELGYDGDRRPSLRTLAPDVVAQLGTFSKTFSPGLRTGWISAPAPLVAALSRAKQFTDQCTSPLGQLLLEDYGRSGGFDEGIVASRAFYRGRCEIMMKALEVHLPEWVRFTRPEGGFFTWLTLPGEVDTLALAERALAEHITFVPGSIFYPDARGRHELRLAYSRVPDEQIDEGVGRLARILAEITGKGL